MSDTEWTRHHAALTLKRIMPNLEKIFNMESEEGEQIFKAFESRLHNHWPRLFALLIRLYGHHYDFFYHMEQLLVDCARNWIERPAGLKYLDMQREADPLWFQSEKMIGGVIYVDLFSDNLSKLQEHIDYFKTLGLTYLHLMPIFAVPRGNNDGGYAVSDYRSINPALGAMDELTHLAERLRREGMSLVLDFVFNHTSDEHRWAQKAKDGDPYYQDYYYMFPDRHLPDQYERTLRDIFPTVRRGSFTWNDELKKWIWTTFNSFQWDLNYANPCVFRAMAQEMLFLANTGVEILRLDAVAFIWKRLGTDCENQPEAHMIIQAFNTIARIAAPSLLFKSEAIVHPDEVVKYIGSDECQLSYNPMLMALLWEALATREIKLLEHAMRKRHRIPHECAWVNYLRCHDDIGWTFDDIDAAEVGIDPHRHRRFLNEFYTGKFPGSFARGLPFQFNPDNGDLRISGTLASLAGLEQAIVANDQHLIEMAVRRLIMLRSIVLSIGGIPLIYLGEERGTLNDYSFFADDRKAQDSRWVHRTKTYWNGLEPWNDPNVPAHRIFEEVMHLIRLRKNLPAFRNGGVEIIHTENPHLFGYIRRRHQHRIVIVNNFSEHPQQMSANLLRVYGLGYRFVDHVTRNIIHATDNLHLDSYQFVWLEVQHHG